MVNVVVSIFSFIMTCIIAVAVFIPMVAAVITLSQLPSFIYDIATTIREREISILKLVLCTIGVLMELTLLIFAFIAPNWKLLAFTLTIVVSWVILARENEARKRSDSELVFHNAYVDINLFESAIFIICLIVFSIFSYFVAIESYPITEVKTITEAGEYDYALGGVFNRDTKEEVIISYATDTKHPRVEVHETYDSKRDKLSGEIMLTDKLLSRRILVYLE